jgi:hypothetical protein
MVMVVVHTVFVASCRPDGLDTTKKTVLDQHAKRVVHGLTRDRANIGLRDLGHLVCRHVRLTCDGPEHGNALGSRLNSVFAKPLDRTGAHQMEEYQILD